MGGCALNSTGSVLWAGGGLYECSDKPSFSIKNEEFLTSQLLLAARQEKLFSSCPSTSVNFRFLFSAVYLKVTNAKAELFTPPGCRYLLFFGR